jgi:ABC-type siderophore export system fused ATPase/permease subunit
MYYFLLITWISMIIQAGAITLSIGAGLYYMAEIVEEYAYSARKIINTIILGVSVLSLGFLFFEDMSFTLIAICCACNFLYYLSMSSFPIVEVYSPSFILSLGLYYMHTICNVCGSQLLGF